MAKRGLWERRIIGSRRRRIGFISIFSFVVNRVGVGMTWDIILWYKNQIMTLQNFEMVNNHAFRIKIGGILYMSRLHRPRHITSKHKRLRIP